MLHKILIVLLLIHSQVLLSQEKIKSVEDLKVGLVLSGGGAKGFAHIGVLKVLEEAGVRIDYIGGTSAGAIIGALYSSGYTASQLDSVLTSFDYNELMQDKLPRKSKSIYQKENDEKYVFSLPIKNRSIALPSAVSKGQNLFNVLSKLTEHVHTVDDFSKLPIPFFCVATNLENGNTEILERGFLPEALRASGSFPTLLDPVEVDGKLLTDGGVVNNFPVNIMKEKGVDIIIGIDVQGKLNSRENLKTAPKIIMQIVSFQMYDDDESKIEDTDLYIHPDISDYNVVSFEQAKEIIDKGEEVAKKQLNYLQGIAKKQQKKAKAVIVDGILHSNDEKFLVSGVKISGNKNYTRAYILGKLRMAKVDSITYKDFYEGIDNLSATNNFRSIYYKFVKQKEGVEIHFNLKEEEVSSFLKIGVHYDDLYKTGVLLNFTSNHTLFKNDIFSADLVLGDNIRYNIDYFIDNGFHWSYGVNTRYNGFKKSFFIDVNDQQDTVRSPVEYNNFTTQLFLQTSFSKKLALKVGAEYNDYKVFTETLSNNKIIKNYLDNNGYLGAFAKLQLDTYDKKNFTKKGVYLDVNYKTYLFSSQNSFQTIDDNLDKFIPFSLLYGKLGFATTFFDKLTFHYISEGGVTFGGNENVLFEYLLGGNNENFANNFIPFYGYDVADLSESAFLKSAFTLRYEPFDKNYVSITANYARTANDLFNGGAIFDDTKSGYAVGYGLDSYIGPVEIKHTWSPDTKQNYWFLNIGFWF